MIQILMPTYNGEKYLSQQLDSLLEQDLEDWQLIISDDGSADLSTEIIESYACRYPDKITVHHSGRHFGDAGRHYLYLLGIADADYVMFCDQDDVWCKDKISVTYQKMKEEENGDMPVLVFTDLTPVDSDLKEISASMMSFQDQDPSRLDYRDLIFSNCVTGSTVMINRPLRDMALACKDDRDIIMHDWWLAIVAARFGRIAYIDKATVLYRQHGSNQIGVRNNNGILHVFKRMADLRGVKEAVRKRKQQARLFLDTYRDSLTAEDIIFLSGLSEEKSGLRFYLRYRRHMHRLFRLQIGRAHV